MSDHDEGCDYRHGDESCNNLDELKPCPFCNNPAVLAHRDISQKWIVRCSNSDCQANQEGWTSREDAVGAWNRRNAEAALAECEARMAKCEREKVKLKDQIDTLEPQAADAEEAWLQLDPDYDGEDGLAHFIAIYQRADHSQQQKIADLEQFAADTTEGFDCLPTCDSTAHDEKCPVAHPVEAWRALREKLAECEARMARCERENVELNQITEQQLQRLAECEQFHLDYSQHADKRYLELHAQHESLKNKLAECEQQKAKAEAYGREYIERTDPLLACNAAFAEAAGGRCGNCRMCLFEKLAAKSKVLNQVALAALTEAGEQPEVAQGPRKEK